MFLMGYILQRFLIGRIIERPQLVSLLITFALSIIMTNVFKLFFTATPRSVKTNLSGFWRYGNITIPIIKTYSLLVALIMMVSLSAFLKYTRLGKSIRAAAQNREAARMVGIEISHVYTITFAICIALTGAAGVLVSPIKPVWPFMGPPFTLKAFAITTMSGLGSVSGALLGSIILGLVEVYIATYFPVVGTNLGIVSSFVILVVILAFRPQGLFGGLKVMDAQH
jgi:branched-chain amino acid transport system permease protein